MRKINSILDMKRHMLVCLFSVGLTFSGTALANSESPAFPLKDHVDQFALPNTPAHKIVQWGGLLFGTEYNRLDGVGANLSGDPQGSVRFSRVPRMDLPGYAFNPLRNTGPNAQNCAACHQNPVVGGGGSLVDLEIRDTLRTGDPSKYIQRDPIHLHGSGALQLLAEQITQELKGIRAAAISEAVGSGQSVTVELASSTGVSFGFLTATPAGDLDLSQVEGISPDLIVRPYTWKGSFVTFLRPLVTLGAELEMGMQPVEFFGPGTDFDMDGVANEMSVGDITAITTYIASLPRPVSKLELSAYLGDEHALSATEKRSIKQGKRVFSNIGCADCHKPVMKLKDAKFREPSQYPEHRFPALPTGQNPADVGLDPANPVVIDLAANPQIGSSKNDMRCRHKARNGDAKDDCFLQYPVDRDGNVLVRLYGDLKWHDMGPGLAENIDEAGNGASVWKTRELWGVGNTGPWLHDGRATTLHEAIDWHGGEAQSSRDAYLALQHADQKNLINFLNSLVIHQYDGEDDD